MAKVRQDLKYTAEHEWAKAEGALVRVGITDYAQEKLGDVVFVELPKLGADVRAKAPFGAVESVKAVSELFAPVSGQVVEVNSGLGEKPEVVNSDAYGAGWMIVIQPADPSEIAGLLTPEEYEKLTSEE